MDKKVENIFKINKVLEKANISNAYTTQWM